MTEDKKKILPYTAEEEAPAPKTSKITASEHVTQKKENFDSVEEAKAWVIRTIEQLGTYGFLTKSWKVITPEKWTGLHEYWVYCVHAVEGQAIVVGSYYDPDQPAVPPTPEDVYNPFLK